MTSAQALLQSLQAGGVSLRRVGDRLRLKPMEAVSAHVRRLLLLHRAELLSVLPDAGPDPGVEALFTIAACEPKQAPIRIDRCTVIVDTERFIEQTLIGLRVGLEHRQQAITSHHAERIEEYVERLAVCGCRVRVVHEDRSGGGE